VSSRRFFAVFILLAIAIVAFTACRREPRRPAVERIAILRFENLGADQASDWMGRAFSEIITSELGDIQGIYAIPSTRIHAIEAAMGGRPVAAPGISAERAAALAAGATKIAFGEYAIRGARLAARMTVEDEFTGRMTVLEPVSAPPGDIVSAASGLAREISARAKPYSTKNPFVVETHVKAFEHLGNADTAEDLQKAIAADPNFGPAYRQLAQIKIQQKDIPGAKEILARGLARGNQMSDVERALLQLEDANLRNDSRLRVEALTSLTAADPHNPEAWQELAAASVASHRYQQAVDAFLKAAALQPDDANVWNQLGYAAAYAGDAGAAADAIERYRQLAPDSANPLDSLGDVNLIAGRLPQAQEIYLQNAKKFPEFFAGLDFLKAAMAHLMTGDVSGADALAAQYFDARATAKDPAIEYRKAQWAWISGRRKTVCQQMAQLAGSAQGALSAHLYAELSIWTLMLGDREGAANLARKAASVEARTVGPQVALARFFSQPPASAAEWQAREKTLAPNPEQAALGNVALVDALLLAKEFPAALPLLKTMYENGNAAADEGLPVLLAWAYVETGHIPEAAELLRANPPLSNAGLTWSTSLYFPRLFYLRAVVAEKQGKADQARENWRIFHALSGPDAMIWGEEQQGK
jgi:tetratricopeptide (TPR) repeat protein